MRKVVIHRPGGRDRLLVEQAPDPVAGPGEVLVDVQAVGVNYADCIVRQGLYASAKKYVGWPITPGFEVAGTRADTGERVVAVTRFGGYAERLVVAEHQVFPLPAGFSMAQGATFPAVHLTGWYALHQLVRLRPGIAVLVHSAAGGVGGALVQLATAAGCIVTGVVGGAHKVETARQHGAAHVIDKRSEPLWPAAERAAPNGFDLVLDANGVETLQASWDHLAPEGKLVVYGFASMFPRGSRTGMRDWPRLAWGWLRTPRFSPLEMTQKNRSVLGFNLSFLFHNEPLLAEGMSFLVGELDAGRLRAPPVTEVPFDDVAEAHRLLESGETVGKLALTL